MKMEELKNILLVSGSGRNCGKTTLVCHAISQLAEQGTVYGLKITPHFHMTANNQQIVAEGEGFRIFKENDCQSGKDSARMLHAGAKEVYFIQCFDEDLAEVYAYLKELIPEDSPIVCESGSLANVYKPGMHILIEGIDIDYTKKSYQVNLKLADVVFTHADFSPSNFFHEIQYSRNNWDLRKTGANPIRKIA